VWDIPGPAHLYLPYWTPYARREVLQNRRLEQKTMNRLKRSLEDEFNPRDNGDKIWMGL
jgi:hypothetical protein